MVPRQGGVAMSFNEILYEKKDHVARISKNAFMEKRKADFNQFRK
jgi:hypothetical protein